jgi:hypothetical protein
MTVLSSFVFAMHTCRKPDPRHLKNLLGKMRFEDPDNFHKMMQSYNKNMMTKAQYDVLRKSFTGQEGNMQAKF